MRSAANYRYVFVLWSLTKSSLFLHKTWLWGSYDSTTLRPLRVLSRRLPPCRLSWELRLLHLFQRMRSFFASFPISYFFRSRHNLNIIDEEAFFCCLSFHFWVFVFVFEIDIPMMIASTRLPPSGSSGSSGSSYCFIDSIAFCSVCTLYHSFFFISNPKPLSGLLG